MFSSSHELEWQWPSIRLLVTALDSSTWGFTYSVSSWAIGSDHFKARLDQVWQNWMRKEIRVTIKFNFKAVFAFC